MFKKLRDLLTTVPLEQRKPFLSPADTRQLELLTRHDGWDVLLRLIDRRTTLLGEEILFTPDIDRVLHLRGQVLGLREAATLVDKSLRQGEDFDAYRTRRDIDGTDIDRRTQLATYGTEFFSRT